MSSAAARPARAMIISIVCNVRHFAVHVKFFDKRQIWLTASIIIQKAIQNFGIRNCSTFAQNKNKPQPTPKHDPRPRQQELLSSWR
jgi:hypothetical protein